MAGETINDYFSSYEDLEVHKLMLEDSVRTEAYRKAADANSSFIKGKTVMDVGCGTGILSIFFAKAGAAKVFAIEASNISRMAEKIVKENNLEQVIEVIHSKVEDLALDIKVDIIVSEWMGFYLLHEGMLDSVLYARDKYLKEDGILFPESAAIYAQPCSLPLHFEKWDDIYGVSMKAMGEELRRSKMTKPEIMELNSDNLLSASESICYIDLKTVKDVNSFHKEVVVAANKPGKFQGISLSFIVWFPYDLMEKSIECSQPVDINTHPTSAQTHWKQTVVVLPEQREVEEEEPIAFDITITRSHHNKRWYDLSVSILDPEKMEHPTPCGCHMTKCIIIKKFMNDHAIKCENGVTADDVEKNAKKPKCEQEAILQDEVISDSD